MSDESRRILDMLAQGKITVDEAEELLKAVHTHADAGASEAPPRPGEAAEPKQPRFIRISVKKNAKGLKPEKRVDIRVPISLMRSGMRLGGVVPGFVHEKWQRKLREQGIDVDLSKLDDKGIEDLLNSLGDVVIDVNEGDEHVRIVRE